MNRITGIAAATMMALTLGVAAAQGADINGEVKKIDEGAGKITLKHGPAKSLGMEEPMTMVYRVRDPALLKQLKVGDKVLSTDGVPLDVASKARISLAEVFMDLDLRVQQASAFSFFCGGSGDDRGSVAQGPKTWCSIIE